jgi:hypothetical protein
LQLQLIAAINQKKSTAGFTTPKYRQMLEVGAKAVFFRQNRNKRSHRGLVKVYHIAAHGAYQVMMVLMAGAVETHAPVAHVGIGHHAHLF